MDSIYMIDTEENREFLKKNAFALLQRAAHRVYLTLPPAPMTKPCFPDSQPYAPPQEIRST
jgi:hypothetical protein